MALDPGLRVSQYQKQFWGVEQGLPHNYVTSLAQSRDGFLWIGTDEGLVRFDGWKFRTPAAPASLRLDQRWVSALLPARDGALWTGTFDGQLAALGGTRAGKPLAAGGSIFALQEDREGVIRVSSRRGVFRVAAGELEREKGVGAPLETSWNVFATDAQGGSWVVDARGLNRLGSGSAVLALANGARHGQILTVAARGEGGLWLGTSKGVFLLERAARECVPLGTVPGLVVSLLEDRDGSLWVGTWGQGLYRLARGKVEGWTAKDGLPDDFIRTLAEDSEGNLWIGMRSGGLGRWKDPRIVPVGTAEGLAGNFASTVTADRQGALWLGTWRGGLYRLREGRLEPQPTPLPVLLSTIRTMAFDLEGHPWIGNWEGLFEFDGVRYRHYAEDAETPFRRVSVLLFDRRGALWVGTADQGLFRFREGRPGKEAPETLLAGQQIFSLLEDAQGRVWAGAAGGLGYFEAGGYRRVSEAGAEPVESLTEDSRGRVWATTAGGSVVVVSQAGVAVLGRALGLPAHALYRVLEDDAGSFWISSPRGLLELQGASLEEVLSGKRAQLEIVRYGTEDGMRTIECHGLSQPAGGRSRDGSLWFPTARGFVRVRPERPRPVPPLVARIEEIASDAGTTAPGGPLSFRPGTRNVEIRFTAVRLGDPGKVQFRFRMGGFDPEWVEAGAERSARYNQLPPGEHLFEVQAREAAGEWGGTAAIRIDQQPRFHETWWFVVLAGGATAGLIYALYRWRLFAVQSRYAAVLEERNRIGREWHDTLVAGFSAISLQLEAAMGRLREQPERASDILEVTRKMVHHYRAEARRVIWDLRDNRPAEETLPVAIENALRRVTDPRGIQGAVDVDGEAAEMPIETQHNVLRICQEAMSNAARHGAPSRIDVKLEYGRDRLRVRIHDDGRGFDARLTNSEANGHFGLTVMEERARRLGGRLTVESAPEQGTTVEADIPLSTGARP
jgi:signal transduction histidine kinase/ligand-binding sensor domain-containing protein